MISFYDSAGRLKRVNREWERVLGWTFEEARKIDILAQTYPDPERRKQVLDFIQKPDHRWADFSFRARDGRIVDAAWARFELSGGTRIGFGLDITERKRAETALAESDARFSRIFQASPVALSMSTTEGGRILEVNQTWLDVFGYRRDEVIGRTNEELNIAVNPEDRGVLIHRLRAEGVLRNAEVKVRRKSGEILDLIMSAIPVDLGGPNEAWITSHVDITDRKRVEAERDVLSARLVDLQESERAELARELHDEVGQLLTGLKIMLLTSDQAAAGRRHEVNRIVDELIARVRDLSMSLRPPMLDLLGVLDSLLWQIQRFEKQTGIRVEFRHRGLDRRFPPQIETATFRVVQEALTNVARHADVDSATVEVTAEHERLKARIEDAGRGFDVTAAPTKPSSGLAGMRERSRLLGGLLTIRSAPGAGTRLELDLPLPDAPGAEEH